MDTHPQPTPAAGALLQAWTPFAQTLGVTVIRTPDEYEKMRNTLNMLLDVAGQDEGHPLSGVLDYVGTLMAAYEDKNIVIGESSPRDMLAFLMDQNGLKQGDLGDCAPQGRISDILSGRRGISKAVAKALARRFHVSAAVFL